MKYKFKAFLGPLISLALVMITWEFPFKALKTYSSDSYYIIKNWLLDSLSPQMLNIMYIIMNIFSNLIVPISIVLLFFIVINIIKGINVSLLLKKQLTSQENLKYIISKKIKKINRIWILSFMLSLIIFIPLSPLFFNTKHKAPCAPIFDEYTQNFTSPPGC